MSEEKAAVFSIEKLYVKDLSIEVPNAPQVFLENQSPELNIELNNQAHQISDVLFEVALHITIKAGLGKNGHLFLIDVTQCGIFNIQNVSEPDMEPLLMIACANVLFPYARETISDASVRAGFQPVLLSPVNFDALFQQKKNQEQEITDAPVQ